MTKKHEAETATKPQEQVFTKAQVDAEVAEAMKVHDAQLTELKAQLVEEARLRGAAEANLAALSEAVEKDSKDTVCSSCGHSGRMKISSKPTYVPPPEAA